MKLKNKTYFRCTKDLYSIILPSMLKFIKDNIYEQVSENTYINEYGHRDDISVEKWQEYFIPANDSYDLLRKALLSATNWESMISSTEKASNSYEELKTIAVNRIFNEFLSNVPSNNMILTKEDTRRDLKKFIGSKLEFGDYILFQEYKQDGYDGKQYTYEVSRPIYAIYLGCFVADQTLGFNYIKCVNEKHNEVEKIENHVEWDEYIDILGHWKTKPDWKTILKSYRKQNTALTVKSDELKWDTSL